MAGLVALLLGLVSLPAFRTASRWMLVQVALEAEKVHHRRHARRRRGFGEMIIVGAYG